MGRHGKQSNAALALLFGLASMTQAIGHEEKGAAVCTIDDRATATTSDGLALGAPMESHSLDGDTLRAPDCDIDAQALDPRSRNTLFVDVRSAAEFERVRIPGSARIPLAAVASNALVKSSDSVVLVGSGKEGARLLRRCEELYRGGLSQVRVLGGGLPAWYRAGGPVAGNTGMLGQPLQIDPRELHQIRSDPQAIFVLANGRSTSAITQSGVRIVDTGAGQVSPDEVRKNVPRAAIRAGSVVVFLRDNSELKAWRALAESADMGGLLFFVGDVSRYDAYLRQQASIAAAARKPRESSCAPG